MSTRQHDERSPHEWNYLVPDVRCKCSRVTNEKENPSLRLEQANRKDETCALHMGHKGTASVWDVNDAHRAGANRLQNKKQTDRRNDKLCATDTKNKDSTFHTPPWLARALTASVQSNWFLNCGTWLHILRQNSWCTDVLSSSSFICSSL